MSVSADGCLSPSMPELARLIGVGGYMAKLDTQWLPSAALSVQSRINYEQAGIDERLIFDWDNQRIYFETATTCHEHESIYAGSTELGGNPEVTYSWQRQDGVLAELVADIPQPDNSVLQRSLIPDFAHTSNAFPGYRLLETGAEHASLIFSDEAAACTLEPEAVGMDLVVSARQAYQFSGYDPQPLTFQGLALEMDQRTFAYPAEGDALEVSRILRYGFLDPAMSGLANVDTDLGFEWALYYPAVGDAGFMPDNPSLIREAYLKKYSGVRTCGREFEDVPSAAFARVEYDYKALSDYLVGLIQ